MGLFSGYPIFTSFKIYRQQSWGLGSPNRTQNKNTASGHQDFALRSDWCFLIYCWSMCNLSWGNKSDTVFPNRCDSLTAFPQWTFSGKIIIRFGTGCTGSPTAAIPAVLMTCACVGSHWMAVPGGSLCPEGCCSSQAAHLLPDVRQRCLREQQHPSAAKS